MSSSGPRRQEAEPAGGKRVLVLTLVFSPDGVSTAQLLGELTTDLVRRKNSVTVVTTAPHYNRDLIAEAAQQLTPVWPGLLWRSRLNGVTVYHCRSGRKSARPAHRLVGWLVFHLLALVTSLLLVRRADVLFVPSPLLTLGGLARLLARPLRGRVVYNVQELYPDLAIELGLVRNRVAISALRWLERYVYRGAAAVTTITDSMREAVVGKGVDPSRVVTIPNFVDTSELAAAPKDNEFSDHHRWAGRFVVLYAGNIGYAQGLDVLIDAARLLDAHSDVLIALIGDGAAKAELQARVGRLGLSRVVFIEHQPYASMRMIYAAADVGVVSLDKRVRVGALPSKLFRIMACERPVLALCGPESELAATVIDTGCGAVVSPDDSNGIARVILELKRDRRIGESMGTRGRAYVMTHLARETITKRYASLFSGLR